jgi:hypothetical protein
MLKKFIFVTGFVLLMTQNSFALNLIGRMGVGMTNQLVADITAISFKVHRSRSLSMGALIGIDANSDSVDYGAGLKMYKMIFEEPHLNFFGGGMLALINVDDESGYQVDLTLGSEFHLPGVESIGFSFEFGVSINKLDDSTHFQTVGYNFIVAAVHFYI